MAPALPAIVGYRRAITSRTLLQAEENAMNDVPGPRDPRPAAERRGQAADDRDDLAEQRDQRSHARDTAGDIRDRQAHARGTEADRHRDQLLTRLRALRGHLAQHHVAQDRTSTPLYNTDPDPQHPQAPPALVLTADQARATKDLLDDTITLLEDNRTQGAHAAGDRRDSALDRVAAAGDRRDSAHDRDDSSADREQAAVDREQVDFRIDLRALHRQLEAAHELTQTLAEHVNQAMRTSQDRIAESKQLLERLNRPPPHAHPCDGEPARGEHENASSHN
ncbi:hypothetical protein ACQP04_02325 [Pseudonocardia halophobica]|uniref:hypothetical protein n=1 Tax=Pseudonocardia halophobica TaxID=29401 RepID=UPI003D91CDDB